MALGFVVGVLVTVAWRFSRHLDKADRLRDHSLFLERCYEQPAADKSLSGGEF